jgi:hypothetical protein
MDDGTCRIKEWAEGEVNCEIRCREYLEYCDLRADTMPLLGRAWVLQERHLSSRVVYFGEQEMIRECLMLNECECQDTQKRIDSKSAQKASLFSNNCTDHASTPYVTGDQLWYSIIEEYSTQQLTFQKDIFPAIQGIAKRLHRNCASIYYAGFWSSNFHVDMVWQTADPQVTLQPDVWRAPSWSWASVVGGVIWSSPRFHLEMRPIAHLIDISTTPVGEDPLGELRSGFIRLNRPCATVSLLRNDTDFRVVNEGRTEYFTYAVDYFIPLPEITPPSVMEDHEEEPYIEDMYAYADVLGYENSLLMCIGEEILSSQRPGGTKCMALRCIDAETETYERFGLVTFYSYPSSHPHLSFESKTITIV